MIVDIEHIVVCCTSIRIHTVKNENNEEKELWQKWSLNQGIAVAISIRISSFISMSASGYVIYQVFYSDKREAMCLMPLFNDAYNPTPAVCCIESYPIDCYKSDEYECIRGDNAKYFRFTLFTIPVVTFMITIMITIVITMSLLYASVKKQDQVATGYRSSSSTQSYSRLSRRVFVKVVWFIGSFCFIWSSTQIVLE